MRHLLLAAAAATGMSFALATGALTQTVHIETYTYDYGPSYGYGSSYGYRPPIATYEYQAPVTVYRRYYAPPPVVYAPRGYVADPVYAYRPANCGTFHYWRDGVCVDARD